MVTLDKKDVEAIANSRFMRQNAWRMWGSFAGIVVATIVAGTLIQPDPRWSLTTIVFVAVVAAFTLAWVAWWITKQIKVTKALIKECEEDPLLPCSWVP